MRAQKKHRKFLKHSMIIMTMLLALGLFFVTDVPTSFAAPSGFTITATSADVNTGTVTGGGPYSDGDTVNLGAIPVSGYRFVNWTDSEATVVSTYADYSFTAVDNTTLVAHFAAIATPVISTITSAGYDSVKLTWATVPGAYIYDVSYSTSATGNFGNPNSTTGTSYTQTGLTTGKTYYFRVMACCASGIVITYSNYSAVKPAAPIPATPTPKATAVSHTSLKVGWTAVTGATGYKVYRATSSTGTYSYLGATANLSYTNSSLITGKYYYYKVIAYRAVNGVNVNSKTSAVTYAKPVPATPTCSVATKTSTSAKISWTAVAGATKYQIYRSTSATGTYTLVSTAASTVKSYVNTGLTNGKAYYYKVRAYHLEGTTKVYGAYSDVKSITLGDLYYSGLYKVGVDIPAGDYMAVSTKAGYGEYLISTDAAGNKELGYGYVEPNRYMTLVWGQYVNLDYCKIYPLAKAPKAIKNGDGNLISGQYKVGRDIDPGTYVLIPNAGEEYSEFSIDKNALSLDSSMIAYSFLSGRFYVTVSAGQYLTVYGAVGYTFAEAPAVDISKNYLLDGMYLVGKDIPAGTYSLTGLTNPDIGYAAGSFEIYSDATFQQDAIISMGYVFSHEFPVILEEGQYINITSCRMDFPNPL